MNIPSPPHPVVGFRLPHSPIARSVTKDDEDNDRDISLQDIVEEPAPLGHAIDETELLAEDLIVSPSFDTNQYHFYYPQPSFNNNSPVHSQSQGQGYHLHYPLTTQTQTEQTTHFEQSLKPDATGTKRLKGNALAPTTETEHSFASNACSRPVAATVTAAPESVPPHGFQLLPHVSSVSESANTYTFNYPTEGSISKKENKSNANGCRCKESRCLKLYCVCFRVGAICMDSCKCVSCENTAAESGEDGKLTIARQEIQGKKPNAFGERTCRCKKSRCLKMYCACFSFGKQCGDSCKCEDCNNPNGTRALPIGSDVTEKLPDSKLNEPN